MSATTTAQAANETGLIAFGNWQIDEAVAAFKEAAEGDNDNPEYHLNLARAHARSTDFDKAMQAIGEYLRTETDEGVAERYQRLFSSALDEVEATLIETMRAMEMPLEHIGKGIQLWLEYRITVGRRPLPTPIPAAWAAAITNVICRVNFVTIKRAEIAAKYEVDDASVKEKYDELVSTLDIMPADYRYYTGEDNPLDKLVEAARQLDELYARFQEG